MYALFSFPRQSVWGSLPSLSYSHGHTERGLGEGSNTLIHLSISYFCEKSHKNSKWLKLLLCILGSQISPAFQASHYLLPRKFESWLFWARCLEEIARRSTLLYIKDIFLKNSVQTYGLNQQNLTFHVPGKPV